MKKLILLLIIPLFLSTGFRGGCKKIFKIIDNPPSPATPIIIKKTLEKKDSINSSFPKNKKKFKRNKKWVRPDRLGS